MARVTRSARSLVDGLRQLAVSNQQVQISNALKPNAPREEWHNLGAPNQPTLVNGWVNFYSSVFSGFYRDPNGFVHLRGTISSPGPNLNNIFTLPLGYRPLQHVRIGGVGRTTYYIQGSAEGSTQGVYVPLGLEISTNGNITPDLTSSNGVTMTLDSISFPADLSVQIG